MAVERLRWLVWLCNFAGVLPVHMLFKAGRFRRFQIRCNHPLGLWFCTVQLFQLFFVATFSYLAFQFQIATDSRLPFVNKLAGGMLQVSSMVTFISPQLILFHLKRLETAVKLLQQADQILDGIRPPCSTRLRTAIGLLVTLAWSIVTIVSNRPLYETVWPKYIGHIMTGLSIAAFAFIVIKAGAWFTVVHVGYYSIAHRISAVYQYISDPPIRKERRVFTFASSTKIYIQPELAIRGPLRTCGHLVDLLVRASTALNTTFSIPVLLLTTTSTINCTTFLYFAIYDCFRPSELTGVVQGQVVNFLSNVTTLLVLLTAPNMPIKEAHRLREQVMNVMAGREESVEGSSLVLGLTVDRLQLSAGGLFHVGLEMIPSIIATVVTYLVLLLQSSLGSKPTKNWADTDNITMVPT